MLALKRIGVVLLGMAGLLAAVWALYVWRPTTRTPPSPPSSAVPYFRHVIVIVMENRGLSVLRSPDAPYLARLARTWAVDTQYYGVTHVSLPNYIALLTGTTDGTHSDNPAQTFSLPNLPAELRRAHITWQAGMGGLPYPGYRGSWYPTAGPALGDATMPTRALYAKKHDPFMLIPGIAASAGAHVVPLRAISQELATGRLPQFLWITPNLCQDMHGQPDRPGALCPANRPGRLLRDGNRFLAHWIPRIVRSRAWRQGPAVIFLTWDEADGPKNLSPNAVRAWAAPGPEAPPLVTALPWLGPLGGGRVPLLVITNVGPHPMRLPVWADHYSILKTIEVAWHLPLLGAAQSPSVPVLGAFFHKTPGPRRAR